MSDPWLASLAPYAPHPPLFRSGVGFGSEGWKHPPRYGPKGIFQVTRNWNAHLRSQYSPGLRNACIAAAIGVSAAAMAAVVIAGNAYIASEPEQFNRALAERRQSGVYDRKGRLIASVGPRRPTESDRREYAFIPGPGAEALPFFTSAVLALEDKSLLDQGALTHICGTDLPKLIFRAITSKGEFGGSGILIQTTKMLREPGVEKPKDAVDRVVGKLRQLGESCALNESLKANASKTSSESASKLALDVYSDLTPFVVGGGTGRGVETAAQVLWGRTSAELTPGQQLVLAAAAKSPIQLGSNGYTEASCSTGMDKADEICKSNPIQLNHRRIFARAKYAAQKIFSTTVERDRALTELEEIERTGLTADNPFQPLVATKRLINMVPRTQALLGSPLTNKLASELDALDHFEWGQKIEISIDSQENVPFRVATSNALANITRSPQGRENLCMRLVPGAAVWLNPMCGRHPESDETAEVLSITAATKSGEIRAASMTSAQMLGQSISLASLAKLVLAAAAAEANIPANQLVCARQIRDGHRLLRRVKAPQTGFTDSECSKGKGLITLSDVIGESDNLGAYDAAMHLIGNEALLRWAESLGFKRTGPDAKIDYEVSFGLLTASPEAIVRAYGALVSVAYGLDNATGSAPRLIAGDQKLDSVLAQVRAAINTDAQRATLRTLLASPVESAAGTARYLRGHAAGAKTGSVQSFSKDANGNKNAHAKLLLQHSHDGESLNLFIVTSPRIDLPLGRHYLQNSIFASAQLLAFADQKAVLAASSTTKPTGLAAVFNSTPKGSHHGQE